MKTLLVFLAWFFLATSALAASVTLNWTAPENDWQVMGYRIGIGETSGVYNIQTCVGDVHSATISGLRPGVAYFFAIKSYLIFDDEDGYPVESVWSDEIIIVPTIELLPPTIESVREDCLEII